MSSNIDDDEGVGNGADAVAEYVAVVAHPDATHAVPAVAPFDSIDVRHQLPLVFDPREGDLHVEDPVCDVCIVKPLLGDQFPPEFELVALDGRGVPVNLSAAVDRKGRQTASYLGIRRGRATPPVVGMGFIEHVGDRPHELVPPGAVLIEKTVGGHEAYVDLGMPGRTYLLWIQYMQPAPVPTPTTDASLSADLENLVVTLVYAARHEPIQSEIITMKRLKLRRFSDGTTSTIGSDDHEAGVEDGNSEDDDSVLDEQDSDDPDEIRDAVMIAASRARRGSVVSSGGASRRSRTRSAESSHSLIPPTSDEISSSSATAEAPPPPVAPQDPPQRQAGTPTPTFDTAPQARIHGSPSDQSNPHEYFVAITPRISSLTIYVVRRLLSRSWKFDTQPTLLDRYPMSDRYDNELPVALPMFCQPSGSRYRFIPGTAKLLTFVLTNNQGNAVHVASLQIFERVEKTDGLVTVVARRPRNTSVGGPMSGADGSSTQDASVMERTRHLRALNESDAPSLETSEADLPAIPLQLLTVTTSSSTDAVDASDRSNLLADSPQDTVNKVIYIMKSVCILSQFPFYNSFFQLLIFMASMTLPESNSHLPLEHYVSNLFEIPVPPPGSVRIRHQIGPNVVEFWRPELQSVPQPKHSLDILFRHLSIKNVVHIVTLLLIESKIVFFSENECILTPIMESFTDLLFPFRWPNVFIPVFPPALVDFLEAFVPYIFGMTTSTFKTFEANDAIPAEVCVVDLDNNRIRLPRPVPWLPQHQRLGERLTAVLARLRRPATSGAPAPPLLNTLRVGEHVLTDLIQIANHLNEVQSEFLQFQFQLLQRYVEHIKAPTGDINSIMDIFDTTGFLASKSNSAKEFYRALFDTQLFNKFLEDRTYNANVDGRHVFFDAQLSAYEEAQAFTTDAPAAKSGTLAARARARATKTKRVYRTFLPQPRDGTTQEAEYSYDLWPILDPHLVPRPRVPVAITVNTAPLPRRSTPTPADMASLMHEQQLQMQLQSPQTATSIPKGRFKRNFRSYSTPLISQASKKQAVLSICEEYLLTIYNVWFRLFCSYADSVEEPQTTLRHALAVLYHLKQVECVTPSFLVYQYLLEICGKRGLADEARFVFLDMSASGIQADAVTYGWHVQAMAGTGASATAHTTKSNGKRSVLFDQHVDMDCLEMGLVCVCRKCKHSLSEIEVMAGWNSEDESQGTECPKCGKTVIATIAVRRIKSDNGGTIKSSNSLDTLTSTNTKSLLSTKSQERTRSHARQPSEQDAALVMKTLALADTTVLASSSCNLVITSPPQSEQQKQEQPWAFEFVPAGVNVDVPLLKPSLFFSEIQNALMMRKGRPWRTKDQFVREQPTLFWNFTWYASALNLPFETPALHHMASVGDVPQYIGGIEVVRRKSESAKAVTPKKKTTLSSRFTSTKTPKALLPPATTVVQPAIEKRGSVSVESVTRSPAKKERGPQFYDFEALKPRMMSYTVKVNALRRTIQRWPRRLYQRSNKTSITTPRTDEEREAAALLDQIDRAIAEGDIKTAVRAFLEARAKSKAEGPFAPFHESCYMHLINSAYAQGMAFQARRAFLRTVVPSKPDAPSTLPSLLINKPLPPPPMTAPRPFVDEWELLEAYKMMVQLLDELTDTLKADDEAPPLLTVALRDVFRHMRL